MIASDGRSKQIKTYKTMNGAARAVLKASGITVSKPGDYVDQVWGATNRNVRQFGLEPGYPLGKNLYLANPGMDSIAGAIYYYDHIRQTPRGWEILNSGDEFHIEQLQSYIHKIR